MEEFVRQAVDWILTLSPLSIYIIFSLVAYFENVIPPLPGDVLIAFGGYLAAEKIVGFVPLLLITTIASVFGFMSMYMIGAYFGDKIKVQRRRFWLMRFVDVKYYDKAKKWMQKWGQGIILSNRFLAGTRSIISLTSGITRTKFYPTVINATISSLIWNFLLLGFGWIVHENWEIIGHYLNLYGWFILGLLILLIGARIIFKKKRAKIYESIKKLRKKS